MTQARQRDRVPLIVDPRPRVSRMTVDMDLGEAAVKEAWILLRPMVAERGYINVEISNATLYVPPTYEFVAARLRAEFNFDVKLVPSAMLLTHFTWLLALGQDAVLSAPSN